MYLYGTNLYQTDVVMIHGVVFKLRQYGDGQVNNKAVPKGTPSWGKEFKEKSLFYANRNLSLWYTPATMPWWHNYLDLDPTYTDIYNDPLIRVTNKLTDQDRNIAKFGIEKCKEVMEKMGADIIDEDEVTEEFDHIYNGGHYAGGVIMGDEPEKSALNYYLQMRDADIFFVVG